MNLVLRVVAMALKVARKSSLNFWVETLDAPDFVLDMITRGYRLPFAEYPTLFFKKQQICTSASRICG